MYVDTISTNQSQLILLHIQCKMPHHENNFIYIFYIIAHNEMKINYIRIKFIKKCTLLRLNTFYGQFNNQTIFLFYSQVGWCFFASNQTYGGRSSLKY